MTTRTKTMIGVVTLVGAYVLLILSSSGVYAAKGCSTPTNTMTVGEHNCTINIKWRGGSDLGYMPFAFSSTVTPAGEATIFLPGPVNQWQSSGWFWVDVDTTDIVHRGVSVTRTIVFGPNSAGETCSVVRTHSCPEYGD
jgi:hypothetical protein